MGPADSHALLSRTDSCPQYSASEEVTIPLGVPSTEKQRLRSPSAGTALHLLSYMSTPQVGDASSCDPLESLGSYELNPCGLAANNMFNDIIVLAAGPGWYDSTSPHDYMAEWDISWASGESRYE